MKQLKSGQLKNLGNPLKAMTGFKLNLMIWNQSIVLLWEA